MKDYLGSLIAEQTNRALVLKSMIKYPLKYTELGGLAGRCTAILDSQIGFLQALNDEIANREEGDLRDIFRDVRSCARDIRLVEYFGIPPLRFQTEEIGFLNKLMHLICKETAVPLPTPSVCCTSTKYYMSNLFTNVIFVPLGESEFLLHLADLYHELGHYVLENRSVDLRLEPLRESYETALTTVTDYYDNLIKTKRREGGPEQIRIMTLKIHSDWKDWLNEFFCDLFAVYTLGPAYAWAHLHLTAKESDNPYELAIVERQSHPSDEARMRILLFALRISGFDEEADSITVRWRDLKRFWGKPITEYQYAFPDTLLKELARLTLEGIGKSGVTVVNHKTFTRPDEAAGIRVLLNEAWNIFWKGDPLSYRQWEEKGLSQLRERLK